MINDLFAGLLVIVIFLGVGAFVYSCVSQKKSIQNTTIIWRLSVWFLVGAGLTTLAQTVLSLPGIPLTISLFVAGCIALLGIFQQRKMLVYRKEQPTLSSISFWSIVVLLWTLFFFRSLSRVTYTWDSIAFWTPKMVGLFAENRVTKHALIPFNHPEYPLMLPISGADAMVLTGLPSDIAAKVVLFGYTLAFFGLFGSFLRKYTSEWLSIFWLLLLGTGFIFREHVAGEYVGTADILVGIYMMAGSVMLLSKRPRAALIMWLFLPWAKSEGLVFALASCGMMFVLYPSLRKLIIFLSAVFLAPWRLFVKYMQVDSSQYFKFGELYARPWIEYAIYSVHAFREEFRNLSKWNLMFFFFLAESAVGIRKILKNKALLTIYASLTVQLIVYLVIFTVTPEEQASFIATAISRLTLHLAPTAVIMASYLHGQNSKNI